MTMIISTILKIRSINNNNTDVIMTNEKETTVTSDAES